MTGSDVIKLLARLHAQCDIHAYVRGKNRNWFADIIEHGREYNILRKDQGWEEIVKMLRKNDRETVVTSYSVCESFPNAGVADWKAPYNKEYDEPDWDKWYDISDDRQWYLALRGLRKNGSKLIEFCPETRNDVRFGPTGMTVFDLHDKLYKRRNVLNPKEIACG